MVGGLNEAMGGGGGWAVGSGREDGVIVVSPAHGIFFGPDHHGGHHTPTCLNVSSGGEMARCAKVETSGRSSYEFLEG